MISATSSGPSAQTTNFVGISSTSCGASAEERMLALIVYTQTSQLNAAETSIHLNAEQLEQLRDEVKRALEQAKEAKKDAGFWGDIAKVLGSDLVTIATAVAAVAAVAATGGAAAAVLAVVAASASFAAEHAEDLGIPPEVAMVVAVAAGAASLCCGNTQGLFEVTKTVKDTAGTVQTCATVVAGSAKATGGGASIASGKYERDAQYHYADAQLADGRQDLVSADIDDAIERLSEALDCQRSATALTSDIQQQDSATHQFILGNFAGAA
ncbi:MAG TPA: type III secretion system translocon subunit SctE [Polyangiaceae bacterium]|nr:type III secretion system translocon subunit SctE [Polyangiaceae bacterium]